MTLMEPPPEGDEPQLEPGEALAVLLWVVAFVLGFIGLIVFLAERWTRPW
jgi:hypothetical protein